MLSQHREGHWLSSYDFTFHASRPDLSYDILVNQHPSLLRGPSLLGDFGGVVSNGQRQPHGPQCYIEPAVPTVPGRKGSSEYIQWIFIPPNIIGF
jgi:hypothetical protein